MAGRFAKTVETTGAGNFLFGLYIYFIIDFFLHFSARIPAYAALRPTLLLTVIIAGALFAQKDKFRGYGESPAFRAIVALILYIALSVAFVTWPGSVIKNNIPEFAKAISFFFFTALLVDTEKRLRIFLMVFIGCQLLRVLEPLYLHFADGYWGSATHLGGGEFAFRLSGAPADVINPNELGFVIVTVFPFLYYLGWAGSSKLGKLLFLVLTPALIQALLLTMSRSAMLALGVVLWMIFKESKHKPFMIVLILVAAVAVWAQLSPIQKERYLSIFVSDTSQSATAKGRISGMWEEFGIGMRRPLFGHGLGTTPEAKAHIVGKSRAAHNLYAEVIIELGLIGLFFFLRYLSAIYKAFRFNRDTMKSVERDARTDYQYRLNQAMIAIFWMYAFFSLTYWGLSNYYWYMFGGLVVAFSRIYFAGVPQPAAESRSRAGGGRRVYSRAK